MTLSWRNENVKTDTQKVTQTDRQTDRQTYTQVVLYLSNAMHCTRLTITGAGFCSSGIALVVYLSVCECTLNCRTSCSIALASRIQERLFPQLLTMTQSPPSPTLGFIKVVACCAIPVYVARCSAKGDPRSLHQSQRF